MDEYEIENEAICVSKVLPSRLLITAAVTAARINPLNAPTIGPVAEVAGDFPLEPMRLAVLTSKYWGATPRRLTVSFMESTPANLRARILSHMNAWTKAICISFVETQGVGQVRISRGPGGYWSYLGTDILHVPQDRQTMNLEGFTLQTSEFEYRRIIRHETGHTLGFPHERLQRAMIARIDPAKAYDYFLKTQGWDKWTVDRQVLTPVHEESFLGTPADETSIMCYQLPRSITKDGLPIMGGSEIITSDYAFAGRIYPKAKYALTTETGEEWDELKDVEISTEISSRVLEKYSYFGSEKREVIDTRTIAVWITEGSQGMTTPLHVDHTYTLNFKVGKPVAGNLIGGPEALVPDADVPERGLDTHWVVSSSTVVLTAILPDTSLSVTTNDAPMWTATFPVHIPRTGESLVVPLGITPKTAEEPALNITIFAAQQVYRKFAIRLDVDGAIVQPDTRRGEVAAIVNETLFSPVGHLNLQSTHEWTTPPGRLNIIVQSANAVYVHGEVAGGDVHVATRWYANKALVAGPIENVQGTAERFRARWEHYLNAIEPADLFPRLQQPWNEQNWAALPDLSDAEHRQLWEDVAKSPELRDLALEGHTLYEAFFPTGSDLRIWLDGLSSGHRIDIAWLPSSGDGYISHVPWGLMYLPDVPADGSPIDALGFLALRFRIGYFAHESSVPSAALGSLTDAHSVHLLYNNDDQKDLTGTEARWQRDQWAALQNLVFAPTPPLDAEAKKRLLELLREPGPSPIATIYFFCQCAVGDGNDPVLRFGATAQPHHIIRRTELQGGPFLADRPLIFANACSTAATDPFMANELEQGFFRRGCRAFIGTETKVPIQLASRLAFIFFGYFFRRVAPQPMPAGEALAQTRLFLWTRYRNIGGLFYTYVNKYELYMATDAELKALRA
jgi:hypothetical protein